MTAKQTTTRSTPKPVSLKIERLFDATLKALWSYWTDPKKLAKWFNPTPGMDLVVHEYDVRVGGRVKFDMPQPDGNRNPQEGVFHVVKPDKQLVSGARDKSFLIDVAFVAVGKKTRMTVTVTGVPKEFHDGATKGWNAGFDKLDGLLHGPSPKGFTIERTFKASPERLWTLWTTKEGVESWWGPEGFTTKVHAIDPRPGGAFDFEMTATGPEQVKAMRDMGMSLSSRTKSMYVEVVKPRRLVLKTQVDFVPNVDPYEMTSDVKFVKVRGGTKLVFTSTKMHSEEWGELARQGQMSQLDKLAALLGDASAKAFTIERTYRTTPERMWALWTTKKGVESWWAPEGTAIKVLALDLRPDGIFEFEHTATTPEQVAGMEELGMPRTLRVRNRYVEIIEPRRLVIKTMLDFVPGVAPYVVTSEVDFVEVRGGTKVVFAYSKVHSKEWGEMSRLGQMSEFERLGRLLGEVDAPSPEHRPVALSLPSEREIIISRIFDAPPERVFRAHVDPKAFADWWGPAEYENVMDIWEPQPGGAWRVVQKAPDGSEHAFRGVFQEIVPSRRITQTFEYEPQAGHISTQTATFDPEPGGKTKLVVRVVFANQEDRDGMLAAGMEWGISQSYHQLDDLLLRGA